MTADTDKLADKILKKDFSKKEYIGRQSAWDFLKPQQEKEFAKFTGSYFKSLGNKYIGDRSKFIIKTLEDNGFLPFKKIAGMPLESVLNTDNEKKLKPGQKFYITFQNNMVIACQTGKKKVSEGFNISTAHIDSPVLIARLNPVEQQFGIGYMLLEPIGGIEPKDWFNIPLAMHFHGTKKVGGHRKIVDFSIGEKDNEPCFFIPEGSVHLNEGDSPTKTQFAAIFGNRPHADKNFDLAKRVRLAIMNKLNKDYEITEDDLEKSEIYFFPSQKQRKSFDDSIIYGFRQDNWACAFPLLYGFINAKNPEYASIIQFYNGEEVSDSGRASIGVDYLSEVVTLALAYLNGQDVGDHYKGLRRGWSMFADVMEPINLYTPEMHDKKDSAHLGSGMCILRSSGDEYDYRGYRPSSEILAAHCSLLEEKKICYQFALMGNPEKKIEQASATFHQGLFTEGIDFGVPCLSLHRGEAVSTIDLWSLACAANAFHSVKDHKKYLPKKA